MIRQTAYRSGNVPREIQLFSNETSVKKALISMLKYEFGYGGYVSDFKSMKEIGEPETIRIEVKTKVLAALDRTVWTGPRNEMRKLALVAAVFMAVHNTKATREAIQNNVVNHLIEDMRVNTLMLVNLGPWMIGQNTIITALAAILNKSAEEIASYYFSDDEEVFGQLVDELMAAPDDHIMTEGTPA